MFRGELPRRRHVAEVDDENASLGGDYHRSGGRFEPGEIPQISRMRDDERVDARRRSIGAQAGQAGGSQRSVRLQNSA
jgi:hypothetical protein